MRIRTIKPEFWEHPVMGRKSDATKLLAIGLLNVADDEGYFYADAKLIRNAIRPFDDESRITTVSIRELSEIGYISIRKHPTHGDIGKVVAFADHQVINKPKRSKLKELHEYGIDTVSIPDEDRLEGKGKEQGMEEKGTVLLSAGADVSYPEIIETMWSIFPPMSRNRSSKAKLSKAWKATGPKPSEAHLFGSLLGWAKSNDWTKDGGQFAPGAHIWIKDRKWESEPLAIPSANKHAGITSGGFTGNEF